MTQTNLLELNENQYKILKDKYIEANQQKKDRFEIQGHPILTKFAKYWLEALEDNRKNKGLKIYNPTQKECPICSYKWIARTPQPKVCPRCKNRLDKPKK